MKQPQYYLHTFDDIDSINCGLFIVGLCLTLFGFLGLNSFTLLAIIKPFVGILGLIVITFAFLKLSSTARKLIREMTADMVPVKSQDDTSTIDQQSL